MIGKGDLKTVLLVALGVFVAGLVMGYGSNIEFIDSARKGFDR